MKLKRELQKLQIGEYFSSNEFPEGSCRVTASNLRPLIFSVKKEHNNIKITRLEDKK